ncbi:MAG: UDP-N-acetylmuramoyl-L-alanyl-D-glutamate--2,6-diaminopimelate ligase [Desulfobacterales bacterium]|nr:UDP-N-acetylmuramoyl-L-alanyl-D-glutamate--2,6-diaminopimelate ligase [Desulfobacterales bacterium]
MKLSQLLNAIDAVPPNRCDPEIGSIHYHAQQVQPQGLFVAVCGLAADGHDFIDQALDRGAAAIVVQRPTAAPVAVIQVKNTRLALAALSARFYGDPSEAMTVIGITGTNGKTTTAYLVEGILAAAGFRPGVIGTIDTRFGGKSHPNPMTTPESLDLQRILADMRNAGVTHVAMEVSSHAIDLHRIHGCRFHLAVLTNLTQDHLDYHGTMAHYWACKKRLFTNHLTPDHGRIAAVINADDPRGEELVRELTLPRIRVGTTAVSDLHLERFHCDPMGIRASIRLSSGSIDLTSSLVGRHNMENILCAAGVGFALELPPTVIQAGIASVTRVPGRLEPVENGAGRFVYVDYAHTPDALAHALVVLRTLTPGRLICIFGCGGDRDRTKRPLMGEIAGRQADLAVVTSDNPRSESPQTIIADICQGMETARSRPLSPQDLATGKNWPGHVVEPDRRKAIALAMDASRPGDTLLIAGKGHETYQILGDTRLDFDDRIEARGALAVLEAKNRSERL